MQNDERRIAVFIDFENVAMGVRESKYGNFNIELVLKRLVEKGKIMVKRAYSDWHRYAEFKRAFHQAAIELIDVPQTRYSGKNSADIRMVVDALDLSYQKDHIDTFVLVSGDSDFSPLVSKLRENGRYVIGMGVKQSSSDLLINNCDEFIFYEDLVRPTAAVPVVDPKLHLSPKKAEAIRLVLETFQALQREGKEAIYGSMIKQTLIRKLPSFNETYYGYPMFSRLLEDAAENKLLKLTKDQKSGGYIVTLPSESPAPSTTTLTLAEASPEYSPGGEAAAEGVLGTGGPAPVPMEPRDRFRRGRWERGRAYRRPSRFGDSSESIRPFPAPANPTVEPEIVDAATSVTEPLASQQSASSEPVVDEGLEVAAGSPPAASVEPAPPPADSVQAASQPSLPSTEEGSATSPPKPQPGRSRQGRRPQRSQRAAPIRTRSQQPVAASSSSGSRSEPELVTPSREDNAHHPGELSSSASQSGHIRSSGDVPNEAQLPAASKAHASNRKHNAARRSSGSRVRRKKSGPRKSS